MTAPLVVIDIVGLTPELVGPHTPHLQALAREGFCAPLDPILPAVTCSAQSTLLTGEMPSVHGIVGNGWYFRDTAEVRFWLQSNHLVQAPKVWELARAHRPSLRTAVLFWWYNMYSSAELSVTLRPMYPADGRKIPALYSRPPRLERELQGRFGDFPMFNFWGPTAGLASSEWIARAAADLFDRERPDLSFVYLPHLDYDFQRLGPSNPAVWKQVEAIDEVAGRLIEEVCGKGAEVVVLSEYGIEDATRDVPINRVLRDAGALRVRETLGWELLDAGASDAFAVCDHQIAHVYLNEPARLGRVRALLEGTEGIEHIYGADELAAQGLAHPRSGDLVCVAAPGRWFSYYYSGMCGRTGALVFLLLLAR
jgi:predicted AlkP superfamily pyrophosphatase or phosphodiesterase